jgi:uncharacterized membrane protein SpoIIM required for sporulation
MYPAAERMVMPDEMLSRADEAEERERRGEGYVTIAQDARPIAASSIISNNVKVAYTVFAFGITFGIGTILMLVSNGVMMGGAMAIFTSRHVARVILAFVAPHSVLELSAICIAGGGGLLVAAGLLLPGSRTRQVALVENGRRAIALIAGTTLMLLVAGMIEGLISPRVWPMAWKVAVSAGTAVLLIGYLGFGGRGKEPTTSRDP